MTSARFSKLSLLIFCCSLPLQADGLADAFAKIDSGARSFKGMTAGIQETVYTALAKDTSSYSGDIKLKRAKPGDIRMVVNFTMPATEQKAVSFDGNHGEVFYPRNKTAEVFDVSGKKDMVEQVMLLGFGGTSAELKASYDISFIGAETIDGQSTAHLKLIPKTPEMLQHFRQVELWISNSLGVPLQQKFVTSANGDYTQFSYAGLKLNSSLSDKDLQLKLPKDTQIKKVG